jgi:hypothetical protein
LTERITRDKELDRQADVRCGFSPALEAAEVRLVEELLREEIEAAKPDEIAYLEGQALRIARDIVHHLRLLHASSR